MGKKYAATIMERHYVGENAFIFNCSHTVIGEIDEKTQILKDRNGNEYAPMLDSGLMMSEIPYAYANITELNKLKEQLGNDLSLKDAISEFEYLCRKVLYFVGRLDNGNPYMVSFNTDNLKYTAESAIQPKTGEEQAQPQQEEKDPNDMDEGIKQLIMDVVNGVYSLKELKEIRNGLKLNFDDIEQALDTVELQIEASEKGESLTKLPPDPEDEEEQVIEEEVEEEQVIEQPDPRVVDIEDLFNKVTKTLIAQDEPARRVISEIARKELDARKKKEGILLTGPTGVGKTELMRLIAKHLDRPFKKVDSTQLTIPGYVGKDIEEVLWDLFVECGQDLEKAEHAIIFFDEIDKKGSSKKSDVSGQGVLNVLLPFIEGSTYDAMPSTKHATQKIKMDTSNMIVILGGAYTDVYKNLLEKNGIGFGADTSSKPKYRKATTKDFVEKGMMTDEFMGRVTVIRLNDLDVEEIKRVMLESDESAMKIQEEIFEKLGVKLTFTDGYTTEIAKNAHEKKTGARGLNGIIDESTWKAFDEVYTHPGEYEEAILSEETVKDPSNYQLVKRRNEVIN